MTQRHLHRRLPGVFRTSGPGVHRAKASGPTRITQATWRPQRGRRGSILLHQGYRRARSSTTSAHVSPAPSCTSPSAARTARIAVFATSALRMRGSGGRGRKVCSFAASVPPRPAILLRACPPRVERRLASRSSSRYGRDRSASPPFRFQPWGWFEFGRAVRAASIVRRDSRIEAKIVFDCSHGVSTRMKAAA